jgi:hypothetical protein
MRIYTAACLWLYNISYFMKGNAESSWQVFFVRVLHVTRNTYKTRLANISEMCKDETNKYTNSNSKRDTSLQTHVFLNYVDYILTGSGVQCAGTVIIRVNFLRRPCRSVQMS